MMVFPSFRPQQYPGQHKTFFTDFLTRKLQVKFSILKWDNDSSNINKNSKSFTHFFQNKGLTKSTDLSKETGISLSTCIRFARKINSNQEPERKKGTGQTKKLQARITQMTCHHPKWSSYKIGKASYKIGTPKVSRQRILKVLRASGYLKWTPKKVPKLFKIQIENMFE